MIKKLLSLFPRQSKDKTGEFERTNKSLYRENKINQILDELQ